MQLRNGRVIGPTPQETSTMSVNKMPSGTRAHDRHATPEPTVADRPHGHKEAPPQVIPMTNVMPGDSPFVTWDQFQSAMSVIRTVIGGNVESDATTPILPEDGNTMEAFLLRIERRYTQMGLEPREWVNALIDHLVGPALTYWMYLRRTIDLSDWTTVQRRLFERFDRTMSQSQLLTELAKVRWNGNPKEYTDRFAAVAERGLGFAPDKLADYYCTGLPTDLHLLITNNGQGRGHPAPVCPSKGERTRRPAEICKKCGGVGHSARDCPTYERVRPESVDKSSRAPTHPSTEKTERLNVRA
ncbi:hypothetical protein ENH_00056840 [Eimeria necatrix]|uniref:CCHC-type domain-containing protein n=1 Tax=Eimeria necatrix TaxID=51315 RepID=U6MNE5_9EIME|nr:hypothetical protein ENH_00056840 [Eimeria necatrix]CDJ64004.1 hypothetical protein ENH_00056840 [Eimeria necatrix]